MRYPRLSRLFSGKKYEIQQVDQAEQEINDEYELIAVIAAALNEYILTTPGVKLKVVSIRRTGQSVPLWNRTGRFERISGRL